MLLMLSVTSVDKGDIISIAMSIVYDSSSASALTLADLEYRAHQVPQHQKRIAAYRAQHQLDKITPPPCNKRKHLASKYSSLLENEPVTRKRKSRSGSSSKKKIEEENIDGNIRHSHVNDAICRLPAALTLSKHQLAVMSHVLT